MFWIGGHILEVIAYKKWSHMEVQLYFEPGNKPKLLQKTITDIEIFYYII